MLKRIPSKVNPTHTFILDVYKPQGRPAVMTASEVKFDTDGRSFTYIPFQDKHHRFPLGGNNTEKNRVAGLARMEAELREKGWIE